MYVRPERLEEALAALAARPMAVLAGGTDFYPARVGQPVDTPVLDVSRLKALRGIAEEAKEIRIGALATWTEVARARLPAHLHMLQRAAREVGGVQIKNTATVAGNLCNASPAADGIPALLALDAVVVLASVRGERHVPVAQFVLGNRRTARAPDELVTAVLVPHWRAGATHRVRSTFLKLGARRYLVISIVMVAAVVETDAARRIVRAALAVGACSPVAQRLAALEHALAGVESSRVADIAQPDHLAALAPIDDVRGSGAYRREAALELVRRALAEVAAATADAPA